MIYSKDQTKRTEQAAMGAGISQQRMMENAGSAVAKAIRDRFVCDRLKVTVVCGSGNNGGDGFVIARRLFNEGADVNVILINGAPSDSVAYSMYDYTVSLGINMADIDTAPDDCRCLVENSDLIVDAEFGFGFHGKLADNVGRLNDIINRSRAKVVAVDIPSGVECDTGVADEHAVKADHTFTFIEKKICHILYPAAKYCGDVVIVDIGIGEKYHVDSDFEIIEDEMISDLLPERPVDAHKGTFGKMYMVCGSYGMCGAAAISAVSAMKCGVGLVKSAVSDAVYDLLATKLTEPVFDVYCKCGEKDLTSDCADTIAENASKCDSLLIGCGCGDTQATFDILAAVINRLQIPMVIDADGINALARNINLLRNANGEIVLTPHYGEMARMCNITVDELMKDRITYGRQIATSYGVVLVMKGAHTMVFSPDGKIFAELNGNSGMATAGSGDMLAGMIASFLAQGVPSLDAALLGVHFHAVCGDMTAHRMSERSMTVTDMLDDIHRVFL